MAPVLRPGEFVFVTVAAPGPYEAQAMVREPEGVTYVLSRGDADALSLPYDYVAGWITLAVHSSLHAVGVTAAVAGSLAGAGISCNVLSGYFHDHLLVPHDRAVEGVELLDDLSRRHRR